MMDSEIPRFGTSGLRGLASHLSSELVDRYVCSFVNSCGIQHSVFVGRDLRESSPRLLADTIAALRKNGLDVVDCGELPTPALALAAKRSGCAAIMVTGSHVPADRNGLKFYLPTGEISKSDERAIQNGLDAACVEVSLGKLVGNRRAAWDYLERYKNAFGCSVLSGMRIGIYQHSSVARDFLTVLFSSLGADVLPFGRSKQFIPIDTEAIAIEEQKRLSTLIRADGLDAIISTDGDADRPLLIDRSGRQVPGDVLGALTARFVGAEIVCTPITSNSMISEIQDFREVHLTRVGSPFVIEAMNIVLTSNSHAKVVGYEANGGFLLGFNARCIAGELEALLTRDAFLPLIAPLVQASDFQGGLSDQIASLPRRFTKADRINNVLNETGSAFLAHLSSSSERRTQMFSDIGMESSVDLTDGLRMYYSNGRILHLRVSGNAPEFRVYSESSTDKDASIVLELALGHILRYMGNSS